MRCKKVQKLIVAYLDCELSHRKQDALKSHIAGCSLCSAELDKYKKLNGIIEQFPKLEDRSPLFWQKQIADIERKVAAVNSGKAHEPAIPGPRFKPVWQKVAIASATITIAAIVLLINQPQHQQSIISPERYNQPVLDKDLATSKAAPAERRQELGIVVAQPKKEIHGIDAIKKVEKVPEIVPPSGSVASVKVEQFGVEKAKSMVDDSKLKQAAADRDRVAGRPAVPESKAVSAGVPVTFERTVAESVPNLPADTSSRLVRAVEVAKAGVTAIPGSAGTFFLGDSTQMKEVLGGPYSVTFVPQQTSTRNYLYYGGYTQTAANLELMELQVQNRSLDMKNRQVIEIRDIPQSGNNAPRHLQIKMDFQP